MSFSTLGLLCFSMLAAASSAQEGVLTASGEIARGQAFLGEKKFSQAGQAFSAALELEPNNAEAYYHRAEAFYQLRDFKKALPDITRLLALDDKNVNAYLLRSNINKVRGEFDKQKEDGEFAIRLITQHRQYPQLMGKAHTAVKEATSLANDLETAEKALEMKMNGKALKHINIVTRDATNSVKVRVVRSEALLALRDYTTALADGARILRMDSENVMGYVIRARAHFGLGDLAQAMKHYRAGLQVDPDHKECRKHYKGTKKFEKAEKKAEEEWTRSHTRGALAAYEPLLDILSTSLPSPALKSKFSHRACACLRKLKRPADAVKRCNDAVKADDRNVEALMERGRAKIDLEQFEEGVRDFRQAKELEPNDRATNEGLQWAETELKKSKRKDFYKTLEVAKDANPKQIKRAYKKLAVQWHPDKHTDPKAKEDAEKKFKEIALAMEVLTDPEKRARFDRGEDMEGGGDGQQQQQGNPFGGGGGGNFHFHFG